MRQNFKTIEKLSEEVASYLCYWHLHRIPTCKEVRAVMERLGLVKTINNASPVFARQAPKVYQDVYLYFLTRYNRAFKTYLHICGNHMPMKYMKKTR